MTEPTSNLSVGQAMLLLVVVGCSLLALFGTMLAPVLLMSWLSIPGGPEVHIAYVALFCASLLGWHGGKRLWRAAA